MTSIVGARRSLLVMTTSRMPPSSWVGLSTWLVKPNDSMMLLNCVHSGSDKRSRRMLMSPVTTTGSVSTARLSIMDESSVNKSWVAAVDPGRYSSKTTTDDICYRVAVLQPALNKTNIDTCKWRSTSD